MSPPPSGDPSLASSASEPPVSNLSDNSDVGKGKEESWDQIGADDETLALQNSMPPEDLALQQSLLEEYTDQKRKKDADWQIIVGQNEEFEEAQLIDQSNREWARGAENIRKEISESQRVLAELIETNKKVLQAIEGFIGRRKFLQKSPQDSRSQVILSDSEKPKLWKRIEPIANQLPEPEFSVLYEQLKEEQSKIRANRQKCEAALQSYKELPHLSPDTQNSLEALQKMMVSDSREGAASHYAEAMNQFIKIRDLVEPKEASKEAAPTFNSW